MLYVFDKVGKKLGYVKQGHISYCFDNLGKQIAKIGQNGNYFYLYNTNNNLLAMFNGISTFDKYNQNIGNGNLLLNFIYPVLYTIKGA